MPLCKTCAAIDIRQLIVDALKDGWQSSDVPYHSSVWEVRDGSKEGCELCSWVWKDVEEELKTIRAWNTEEGKNAIYELEHEDTGGLVLNANGTPSLKATVNVSWPWQYKIHSTLLSMFRPFPTVGSQFDDRDDILNLLIRGIDASTGSSHTLDLAAQWLVKCKSDHTACSACARGGENRLPTRVIDVGSSTQKPKLFESGGAVGCWAALSYCWGGNSSFILTSSSKALFKEGTALENFPATLRDAISIARALGIPYLWIDALCILQDSLEDWQREAPKMKEIYAGADVVIAATCAADVNAGIFRTRPVADSVELKWRSETGKDDISLMKADSELKKEKFKNETICLQRDHRPGLEEIMGISTSRWGNRGWTMQEDFMATRLLAFQEQTTTWECLTKAEQENRTDSLVANIDEADANSCDSRDFVSRYWKNIMGASSMSKKQAEDLNLTIPSGFYNNPLSMWYKTIEKYSDRRLTQVSDRLPALSGLAALFQQVTGDEYCAGLWKSDLLRGLLWCYQPSRGDPSKVIEMFTTNFEELSSKLDTVYFTDHLKVSDNGPSWSWVSLEGTLERGGQERCRQFGGDVVMPATRIVDVQVDLVAKSNPFGRVCGGRLSIEAAYLSWKEGQTTVANLTKFVLELLAHPSTIFTAEYQLRHQPHQGQVTAVLLIDCNTIQGQALLVESVQKSTTSRDYEDQLYRRVGRFDIKRRQQYDQSNDISPAQNAAYEDCAKGLPVKTFVIV